MRIVLLRQKSIIPQVLLDSISLFSIRFNAWPRRFCVAYAKEIQGAFQAPQIPRTGFAALPDGAANIHYALLQFPHGRIISVHKRSIKANGQFRKDVRTAGNTAICSTLKCFLQ